MRIFVFFHVLSMFTGLSIAYVPAYFNRRAARSGDVPTMRTVFGMTARTGVFIGPILGVGFLFALLAIFTQGLNPFRPWLLFAYVLFAIGIFDGVRIHAPWGARVLEAANASPVDAPSDGLRGVLHSRGETVAFWIDLAVVVLLLFDMIMKPFGL